MKDITIKLTGSRTDGYILSVYNKKEQFRGDIALKFEELVEIKKVLVKKLK